MNVFCHKHIENSFKTTHNFPLFAVYPNYLYLLLTVTVPFYIYKYLCQPLSSNIVPPSPNTPKPLPFAYLMYALHLNELPFLPSSMNSLLYTYISKNVDYTYIYGHYTTESLPSHPRRFYSFSLHICLNLPPFSRSRNVTIWQMPAFAETTNKLG